VIAWAWMVAAHAEPVTTDAVVAASLATSVEVASARAEVARAEAILAGARGLRNNPTIEVHLGFGLPQHEVAVAQPVSFSGEGMAAVDAAEAAVRAARAAASRVELEVAADTRRALAAAVLADATRQLADALASLTQTLRTSAEAQRAAGEASDLEVQLARLDESAAVADQLAAARASEEARAALVARCALPWSVELPVDAVAAVPAAGVPTAHRLDAVAAAAEVEAARADVRREGAAVLPPVELGVWAQVQNVGVSSDGTSVVIPRGNSAANLAWTVGPSLVMTLPVFKANPDGRGAAAAAVSEAEARARAVEAAIAVDGARAADRQALVAAALALPDPAIDARAALDGLTRAVAAGELGPAEAAGMRARVMDAWRRAIAARAPAIDAAIDRALAEEWETLLPAR
jgi:outer membrane protein TolC